MLTNTRLCHIHCIISSCTSVTHAHSSIASRRRTVCRARKTYWQPRGSGRVYVFIHCAGYMKKRDVCCIKYMPTKVHLLCLSDPHHTAMNLTIYYLDLYYLAHRNQSLQLSHSNTEVVAAHQGMNTTHAQYFTAKVRILKRYTQHQKQ